LDGPLPPTESFENSYITPVSTKRPFRDRSKSDNTCFTEIINVQRPSASAWGADPYHNPTGETITLSAGPIVSENNQDTYYIQARHNNQDNSKKNNVPPLLCLVSDSFWLFSSKGPAIYETQGSWNSVFQKHFPDLFQQLLEEAGLVNTLAPTRAGRSQQYNYQ
jgi:hypothetical protein